MNIIIVPGSGLLQVDEKVGGSILAVGREGAPPAAAGGEGAPPPAQGEDSLAGEGLRVDGKEGWMCLRPLL